MPAQPIVGLHHVTAIASDPQANLDFYTQVLGLRFVKRTVNFDDPGTYHFYFGDDLGSPGTILTFFPWPHANRGSVGAGEVTQTAFSVALESLGLLGAAPCREAHCLQPEPSPLRRRGPDAWPTLMGCRSRSSPMLRLLLPTLRASPTSRLSTPSAASSASRCCNWTPLKLRARWLSWASNRSPPRATGYASPRRRNPRSGQSYRHRGRSRRQLRPRRRRVRPPHRLPRRRTMPPSSSGVAEITRAPSRHRGSRPRVLPFDLLPRTRRRALRAGYRQPRLRGR